MHKKGLLGKAGGKSDYGVVTESYHNEFSDMCMLTPTWLARAVEVTGKRNPIETAEEIVVRTLAFLDSVKIVLA